MKLIYVSGDDSAALEFENYFKGKNVKEIIERFGEEHDGDFELELFEFDEIDPKFIKFIRNEIQDYDDSKHSNFYCEGEIIG